MKIVVIIIILTMNIITSKLDNGEDEYITTEKMTWTFK